MQMEYVKDIDILGVRESGVVELEIRGCLSRHTVNQFNAAVGCFDYNLKGVVLDTRESLIALLPEQIDLFRHVFDCPLVYLIAPEQIIISEALVNARQPFGYRRSFSSSKAGAQRWLDMAIRQAR